MVWFGDYEVSVMVELRVSRESTAALEATCSLVLGILRLFTLFLLLLANRLHQLIELSYLLVYTRAASSVCMSDNVTVQRINPPLILSILPLSNCACLQLSPSIVCAYICHSVKKPICGICQYSIWSCYRSVNSRCADSRYGQGSPRFDGT